MLKRYKVAVLTENTMADRDFGETEENREEQRRDVICGYHY